MRHSARRVRAVGLSRTARAKRTRTVRLWPCVCGSSLSMVVKMGLRSCMAGFGAAVIKAAGASKKVAAIEDLAGLHGLDH